MASAERDAAVIGYPMTVAPSGNGRAREHSGHYGDIGSRSQIPAWEPPATLAHWEAPAFPTAALPPALGEYAAALSTALQTPLDLAAWLTLSVCGAACAKRVRVLIREGWSEPTNLFTAVAMESGEGKSPVFAACVAPLELWEREQASAQAEEIAARQAELRILQAQGKDLEERASRAQGQDASDFKAQALDKARELARTKPISAPRLLTEDCTPEQLAVLLSENQGRLALFSDEGGVFDIMAGRYSDGKANLDVYLKGYSGSSSLRVDRIGRPPLHIQAPALTVALAVQPDVLRGLAEQRSLRGRGLLARFLYALPPSMVGSRAQDPPTMPASKQAQYVALVSDLLEIEQAVDDDGEPVPHMLPLGQDARALLYQYGAGIEQRLGHAGDLAHIQDWANKFRGNAARLAGILHLAGGGRCHQPVGRPTMQAALTIIDYALAHALAVFGLMGADPALPLAERAIEWLQESREERAEQYGGRDQFSKRDLWQSVRGRLASVKELEPALDLLVAHGYLRPLAPQRSGKAGRPPGERFSVNPHLYCQYPHNPQNAHSGDIGDFGIGNGAATPTWQDADGGVIPLPERDY